MIGFGVEVKHPRLAASVELPRREIVLNGIKYVAKLTPIVAVAEQLHDEFVGRDSLAIGQVSCILKRLNSNPYSTLFGHGCGLGSGKLTREVQEPVRAGKVISHRLIRHLLFKRNPQNKIGYRCP